MTAPTPSELLANAPVHNIGETAVILGYVNRDGKPRRDIIHELIRSGGLRIVDPEQIITRWVVSTAEIYRYINEGRRTGAEIVELRGVS